jgi:hypothetical protein
MANPQVQNVLKGVAMGQSRFIYGLSRVPDDRLNWSPGGAAKTPLQLAGKTAAFIGFFTTLLETRQRPAVEGGWPPPPQSREEATAKLEEAFGGVRRAIAGLSEADLAQIVPTPMGEAPIREVIAWLGGVIAYHQGQLNYLQMAYGDEDPNMPPNWGKEEL